MSKSKNWFDKGTWIKKDSRNKAVIENYKKFGAVKTAELFRISRARVYQIVNPQKYNRRIKVV